MSKTDKWSQIDRRPAAHWWLGNEGTACGIDFKHWIYEAPPGMPRCAYCLIELANRNNPTNKEKTTMADKPRRPKVGMPIVVRDEDGIEMPALIQEVLPVEEGQVDLERVRLVAFLNDEVYVFSLDHSEDKPFRNTWRYVEED